MLRLTSRRPRLRPSPAPRRPVLHPAGLGCTSAPPALLVSARAPPVAQVPSAYLELCADFTDALKLASSVRPPLPPPCARPGLSLCT